MFDEILEHLRSSLAGCFPNIPCYCEYQGQQFERPAFFLMVEGAETKREIGDRYRLTCRLQIRYYDRTLPTEGAVALYRRLADVALVLYNAVDYRYSVVTAMEHQVVDKTLVFSVSYQLYVRQVPAADQPAPADKMATLHLVTDHSALDL